MTAGERARQWATERQGNKMQGVLVPAALPGQPAPAWAGGAPAPAAAAPAPSEAPAQGGFSLPELDPNDPDYADKKEVHDAILALDQHFSKVAPNIDFQKQYGDIIETQKGAPQKRDWGPLSKFAVAIGTQGKNPYEPNVGLSQMEDVAQGNLAKETSDYEKVLGLKKAALEGHINQLMSEGKFKQALAQLAVSQDLAISEDRRKHKFEMEKTNAQNDTKRQIADAQLKAAEARAEARAAHAREVGQNLKLSPTDKAEMNARIDAAAARYRQKIARDPLTGILPEQDTLDEADDDYRIALRNIHNEYEDREIGERPPKAAPPAERTERPSGQAWKSAAGR